LVVCDIGPDLALILVFTVSRAGALVNQAVEVADHPAELGMEVHGL
jgi:hypothetical protein